MSVHNGTFHPQKRPIGYLFFVLLIIAFALSSLTGCESEKSQVGEEKSPEKVEQTEAEVEKSKEEFGHLSLNKQWKGDFDGMVERRLIRALVVFNKMQFFVDQGQHRGVSVELLEAFEKKVNEGNKDKALQIDLIFLPVYRDQLIPALVEGKGDIAVGNLTITEERLKQVDFS